MVGLTRESAVRMVLLALTVWGQVARPKARTRTIRLRGSGGGERGGGLEPRERGGGIPGARPAEHRGDPRGVRVRDRAEGSRSPGRRPPPRAPSPGVRALPGIASTTRAGAWPAPRRLDAVGRASPAPSEGPSSTGLPRRTDVRCSRHGLPRDARGRLGSRHRALPAPRRAAAAVRGPRRVHDGAAALARARQSAARDRQPGQRLVRTTRSAPAPGRALGGHQLAPRARRTAPDRRRRGEPNELLRHRRRARDAELAADRRDAHSSRARSPAPAAGPRAPRRADRRLGGGLRERAGLEPGGAAG